jgi:hypothetical protein
MEQSIKNAFIDQSGNIFLIDVNDILYLYDDISYPFPIIMENIYNCFLMDYYFIHYSRSIRIFNEEFMEIQNHVLASKTNIDKVCYCNEHNAVITLEDQSIYVNFNRKYRASKRLLINQYYQPSGIPKKYNDIKLFGNMIFARFDDNIDVFNMGNFFINFIQTIQIDQKIYNDIFDYDVENSIFYLLNGNIVCIDNNIHSNIIKQFILQKRDLCFFIVEDGLLCYMENNLENCLKDVPEFENYEIIIRQDNQLIIKIKCNESINLVDNHSSQLIIINKKVYYINRNIVPIKLFPQNINYEIIIAQDVEKDNTELIIDIVNDISVVKQLIHIIPSIYRYNNEMNYLFHQVDNQRNVISYGIGVSRQIYYLLRKEIDDILGRGLIENYDYFNIGFLIYFCNREGRELFFNLHPYFFLKLSKESDYENLLLNFRLDDSELFIKQLREYRQFPEKLQDLDLDITSLYDYMQYIFCSNLNEDQIKKYDKIYQGFYYLVQRHKFYSIISRLPINYYFNLIAETVIHPEIIYFSENKFDSESYNRFCNVFDKYLSRLTSNEIVNFIQNITGSQFYSGKIRIVLSEKNECNYSISTCFAELKIHVEPTDENIEKIIRVLITEDLIIKN